MTKYENIVLVCTGNTCRSPMAEVIFKNMPGAEKFKVISKGLVVLFPEPCNQKAEMIVKDHGLSLDGHVAQQLKKEDMGENVLVLCMTFAQKIKIAEEFGLENNIFTIKEYVGESGDMMDPYGGTILDYQQFYDELTEYIINIIKKLHEEE